jgi:hypothetical protein
MSNAEFLQWVEFYKLYPFDDYHRYFRPAALVSASMGGSVEKSLEWLQPDDTGDYSEVDVSLLRTFGLKPKG